MKLLASPVLETHDLGGALEFVLTKDDGMLRNLAGPIVVGAMAIYSWRERSIIAMVFAILGVIGLAVHWIQGRETILRVSQVEIVARGNLGSWFTTEITIPVSEITAMGWSAGGEDDSGGLYVASGWKRPCVLPEATEEEVHDILDAIAEKFPNFPVTDKSPASVLFGDDSGVTLLGLNQAKEPTMGREKTATADPSTSLRSVSG